MKRKTAKKIKTPSDLPSERKVRLANVFADAWLSVRSVVKIDPYGRRFF